jgi:hypothetical protein
MLLITLLQPSGAGAAGGGITGGAASPLPSVPYGGGPVPGGPGFVSLTGLDFKPYYSSGSYLYDGYALVNNGVASAIFVAPFTVPNGVTINKMVVYYIDQDAGYDMEIWLVRLPLMSTTGDTMAHFLSNGTVSGVRYSEITTIINPVVDLSIFTYALQLSLPPSTNLKLASIRIDYGYVTALPVIRK